LVRLTQPWPAQEFWPAQLVVAVAQALVPLQELTLKHLPAFSAAVALIGAIANIAAAAAARATPVVFLAVFIEFFLKLINVFFVLVLSPLRELRGSDFAESS
jgi:type III secretory pathway component EscS